MQNNINTAMIFAAGLGTRMQPLTNNTPKPLLSVCGKKLIDYAIDTLKNTGVSKIIINTHYLAEQVQNHIMEIKDIEIIISHETKLLETGGGIVKALPYIGTNPFVIFNSDIILYDTEKARTNSVNKLIESWNSNKMDALLLLHPTKRSIGYYGTGDFSLSSSNQLMRSNSTPRPYVYTGVQICNPKFFDSLKEEPFSLSKLLFDRKQNDGYMERIYGLENKSAWLHVGSPEGLKEAESFITNN